MHISNPSFSYCLGIGGSAGSLYRESCSSLCTTVRFMSLHLYLSYKRPAIPGKAQSSFLIRSFIQNATNLSFKSTQTPSPGKLDLHFIDYQVCFSLGGIGRERRKKSHFSLIQTEDNREKRDQ